MIKRYRNKIYIRIGGFGFEAGWYSGQEPAIISAKLCEYMHGYLCILFLQVWKFAVSAWIDTDGIPVEEKEVMA